MDQREKKRRKKRRRKIAGMDRVYWNKGKGLHPLFAPAERRAWVSLLYLVSSNGEGGFPSSIRPSRMERGDIPLLLGPAERRVC